MRHKWLTISVLWFLFVAASSVLLAVERRIELAHDIILAADLAAALPIWRGADPGMELGRAPSPGVVRRVTRAELIDWARAANLAVDPETLPATISIERRMRPLEEAEALNALRTAVERTGHGAAVSADVELHGFVRPLVPDGDLTVEAMSLPREVNQRGRAQLRWRTPAGRSGIVPLEATIRVTGAYLMAVRSLAPGEEAGIEDFVVVEGELPSSRLAPVSLAGSGGKFRMRCSLGSGEAVETRCVSAMPLIDRGALVELEFRAGAIRLRAPGRAEGPGSPGDVVPCRNLESGKRVLAKVLDAGTVRVVEGSHAQR